MDDIEINTSLSSRILLVEPIRQLTMAAQRIEVIKNHLSSNVKLVINETSADEAPRKKIVLNQYQKDFYDRCGYLVIKGIISEEIIEKCRVRFDDICNGDVDRGRMVLMKEILLMDSEKKGIQLYYKIQDILNDDAFSLYTESPVLLDYVEAFLGPNIMGMHSMLINKPPGSSIHPPHQDLYYFSFRPMDKVIAAWTAMESVYKNNGTLYVVPGTHRGDLHRHIYPDDARVNKAFHGIQHSNQIAPEEMRVYLSLEAGDTVFFHPLLVHGSGPNLTSNCRKAICCHYASSECYYIETDGTDQEEVSNEVLKMYAKKGYGSKYRDLWYQRAKLVRGERFEL